MRVIVNGARGKMGSKACETIEAHPDFVLVAALGKDDNLAEEIKNKKAEIVIDLTRADSVFSNSQIIIEEGAHPVIGTSGLSEKEVQHLQQRCREKQLGGIIAPNFSIGAVLMMHFASIASKWFSEVEIIEMHHQNKLDAPSGTALKTAEMVAKARRTAKKTLELKEVVPGVRGGEHKEVPIHSVRLPGILARQDVIFAQPGEMLTISHNSIDRDSFMSGVILCCKKVTRLKTLYYGLEQLLDL